MNMTELLKAEVESVYKATDDLMAMVETESLGWKPEEGGNWMTTGQLLMHITTACGFCCRGLLTGDWGLPEGQSYEDMPEEDMLPPAEKMPAVETVDQARDLLAADKQVALDMIDRAGEEDLTHKEIAAPWSPDVNSPLGVHFLHMVGHLSSHKAQLFYYLKLMGKPVHTGNLWGM